MHVRIQNTVYNEQLPDVSDRKVAQLHLQVMETDACISDRELPDYVQHLRQKLRI